MRINNEEKISKYNSILLALFLSSAPIAWIINSSGTLGVIYLTIGFLSIIINRKIKKRALIPFFIILVAFLFSSLKYGNTSDFEKYLMFFLCVGFFGMTISNVKIDITILIKSIFISSILFVPYMYTINLGDNRYESVDYGRWLAVTYGLLGFININIFVLLYARNKYFRFVSFICLCCYLNFYAKYGTRGAIVSVILYSVILIFIKYRLSIKKVIVYMVLLTTIFSVFFYQILNIVIKLLELLNLRIYALEKIIYLESSDLSNGRGDLIREAFNKIVESPLYGNGISSYEAVHGQYVHNVFVQVMYEFGLIGIIPLLYVIYKSLKNIVDDKVNIDIRLLQSYLFCCGIVELFFSSTFWSSNIFWVFIGFNLYKRKSYENIVS